MQKGQIVSLIMILGTSSFKAWLQNVVCTKNVHCKGWIIMREPAYKTSKIIASLSKGVQNVHRLNIVISSFHLWWVTLDDCCNDLEASFWCPEESKKHVKLYFCVTYIKNGWLMYFEINLCILYAIISSFRFVSN